MPYNCTVAVIAAEESAHLFPEEAAAFATSPTSPDQTVTQIRKHIRVLPAAYRPQASPDGSKGRHIQIPVTADSSSSHQAKIAKESCKGEMNVQHLTLS